MNCTYNFTLIHRAGKQHANADLLSRPLCSSCSYCERVELRSSGNILVQASCPRKSVVRKAVSKDPLQDVDSSLKLKTCKELRSLQESDPDIGFILRQKETGTVRPKWEEISCKSQECKCYWAQRESLFVKNGLLYRNG